MIYLFAILLGLFDSMRDWVASGKDWFFADKSSFFSKTKESYWRKYGKNIENKAFLGSTFWFVFVTDLFHAAKMLFNLTILIVIWYFALYVNVDIIYSVIELYIWYVIAFHIFWHTYRLTYAHWFSVYIKTFYNWIKRNYVDKWGQTMLVSIGGLTLSMLTGYFIPEQVVRNYAITGILLSSLSIIYLIISSFLKKWIY